MRYCTNSCSEPKIFAAAKKGGIKNYFVEMSLDLLTASYPYLHSLKV